ncbi:MAG: hypothetical protein HF314_04860 [Ignavibacteria bacterium]|nr:hypothetical protein [Ignavibacteria bacterium]MCU7515055.1 hypothetical protein [Ignavibacteria bacterium]
MKKLLILLLVLSVKVYSQEQLSSSEKVESFLSFLKPYMENKDRLLEIPGLSENEIKHYIKLKYEACEDNFKLLRTKIAGQENEVKKTGKRLSYSEVNACFTNFLKEKYSGNFVEFLGIPCLVKARIISKRDSSFTFKGHFSSPIKIRVKVVAFDAMEVLKGNREFQAGKTYRFYYGNNWRHVNNESFQEGSIYLLPLEPRLSSEDSSWDSALITYFDDSCGLYKIENDSLIDKYDFFSFGNLVPWKEFLTGFNLKAGAIKNGDF